MDAAFRRTGSTALALLALMAVPAAVHATLFTATKTTDTLDGACNTDCSLREAIVAADAKPGPDTIILPPGVYTLARAGVDEDLGATGDLDVNSIDGLLIVGAGPSLTAINGSSIDRVFDVRGSLDLLSVTVLNGVAAGTSSGGGAIQSIGGRVTVSYSVLQGNSTTGFGFGGAIYSDGVQSSVTLRHSTLLDNTAQGGGGGITVGFRLSMIDSTISGNRSVQDFGGGVYLFSEAQATFNNVTIAGNTAGQRGGGVFVETPTFSDTPRFSNSIVAGNSAAQDDDCLGAAISSGYNLVGDATGCPGFGPGAFDRTGTTASPLDARLAALGFYGGPTPTQALLVGSPAINAGNPLQPGTRSGTCEWTDQRLRRRPSGGRCDIGAFERKQ
jgi:CSLREA domain-containing protein